MTREIALTRGYVALVDDEDHEWLSQWKWHASGPPTGSVYAARVDGGKRIWMHRLLAGDVSAEADHINRDRMDNRRANLRSCTHQQNTCNRASAGMARGNYKGVDAHGKGYRAQIASARRLENLGVYRTDVEAAVAYDRAALERHGEFALVNFDPKRDWILPEPVRLPRGRDAQLAAPRTRTGNQDEGRAAAAPSRRGRGS